jgi:LuxR family transcriptional regulator, maltose regulon positive regulatory protein
VTQSSADCATSELEVWPWAFRVHVLGSFRLLKCGDPIRLSCRAQPKPLELLQALIAFGGSDVGAGTLSDALYPDSDGDAGYHALESALYRLRRLLGAHDAVRMAASRLSLDRRIFWVDMWEFERVLQSPTPSGVDIGVRFARAGQLYEGHFLEQESECPWALRARARLRDGMLRLVRETAHLHEACQQWQEAALVYQRGLELDALAEDLYRGLMVCHRELGDHSEALQAYGRCRDLLTRQLGVPPSPKTQAIYESVRRCAAHSLGSPATVGGRACW